MYQHIFIQTFEYEKEKNAFNKKAVENQRRIDCQKTLTIKQLKLKFMKT